MQHLESSFQVGPALSALLIAGMGNSFFCTFLFLQGLITGTRAADTFNDPHLGFILSAADDLSLMEMKTMGCAAHSQMKSGATEPRLKDGGDPARKSVCRAISLPGERPKPGSL